MVKSARSPSKDEDDGSPTSCKKSPKSPKLKLKKQTSKSPSLRGKKKGKLDPVAIRPVALEDRVQTTYEKKSVPEKVLGDILLL